MELTESLLQALRCPETKQPLRVACPEELENINTTRESDGKAALESALVREDGEVAYPVEAGFPILLVEEAILIGDSM